MSKHRLSFRVQRESVGFSTQCIEYPAIATQGDTESELAEMIQDVVVGYFEVFPDDLKKPDAQKSKTLQETKDIKIITVNV